MASLLSDAKTDVNCTNDVYGVSFILTLKYHVFIRFSKYVIEYPFHYDGTLYTSKFHYCLHYLCECLMHFLINFRRLMSHICDI